MASPAVLRLMSDLRSIKQEPPETLGRSEALEALFERSRTKCGRKDWIKTCDSNSLADVTRCDERNAYDTDEKGCSASPQSDENLFVWNATVFGPDETPWEGGVFSLRITFTDQYPEKPPRVRFTSEMFHPNVYSDGTLCMDIIQDRWSPCHSISTILTSIQSLLTDPNPASPANPEAAQLYQNDPAEYAKRVRRVAQRSIEC